MKIINRSNATYHTVNMKDDKVPDWPSNDGFRFVDKHGHINVDYSSLGRVKHMHTNIILFIIQAKWCLVLTFVLFSFLLKKCVQDVHNFLSSLLFSIETQHTIGYGSRYITTECMGGILVLTLQSSLGYLLQVIVTQIVFSKLSRPTEKSQFVVFSNYALIAPRNNQLTLTFRIGNLSVSQLIFASVRLLMIRQRRTIEGEIIHHQIYDMELTHLCNGQLFFPRPTVVEHIIDSRSPLSGIQRSTLSKEHFEIIAIIEGSFDYTGFPCHFRTSYLPDELLWGHQFSSCNSTLRGFDYEEFNYTKLINAEPFWNYEEEENNDSTTPNSPNTSPYLSRKELIKTNYKKNLQGQNLIDDNDRVNNKRYGRLSTIESIPNDLFRNITTVESTDNDEEELTENIEKQYVESKQNNQLSIYEDYHFHQTYSIEYQQEEINQHMQLLQQRIDNHVQDSTDNEKDIYFDCVEQVEDDNNLTEILPIDHPWISEISLSVHRKTSIFRRFLNYFNRSKRSTLSNLAAEFIRLHNGHFNHPIGFHFHISYAKEKWLLTLTNIKFMNYPIYPYPQTRIIFIRKGVLYFSIDEYNPINKNASK